MDTVNYNLTGLESMFYTGVRPSESDTHPNKKNETLENNGFHQENLRLGRIIKKYMDSSEEKRKSLEEEYNKARENLTLNNKGYALSCAIKQFQKGFDFNELVQIAMMELYKASRDWDYTISKFTTHAKSYINAGYKKESRFNKTRGIRVSRYIYDMREKISEKRIELTKRLGYNPSDKEIAEELYYKTNNKDKKRKLKPYHVRDTEFLEKETMNIDNDDILYQNIIFSGKKKPLDHMIDQDDVRILKKLIRSDLLNPEEREILRMKFGFKRRKPMNNSQIGKRLDESRQTIKNRYDRLIEKLQSHII